jgi:hypothetical protein
MYIVIIFFQLQKTPQQLAILKNLLQQGMVSAKCEKLVAEAVEKTGLSKKTVNVSGFIYVPNFLGLWFRAQS